MHKSGEMNKPKLIDTHAHLDQVESVSDALRRARESGVSALIGVGMDLASNHRIIEIAEEWPGFVFPALGAHPWSVEESALEETLDFVKNHLRRCVAIGEVGLDYKIEKDRGLQRRAFGKFLEIAAERDLPALTHSRGSYEDVLWMVEDSGVKKAVFHWYSGPVEIAEKIVAGGYHISATPAVEYSKKHREVIRMVPMENLPLETDCPVEFKGNPSEPANINVTLREVAKLKSLDADLVAATTTENAKRLFGLDA